MSKKDLIEQNITRVQEYVRELIEDAMVFRKLLNLLQ